MRTSKVLMKKQSTERVKHPWTNPTNIIKKEKRGLPLPSLRNKVMPQAPAH